MRPELTLRERTVAAATLRRAADKFEWMAYRHGYARAKGTVARQEEREAVNFYTWAAKQLREWADNVLDAGARQGRVR
jgi:hypothetical protein